MLKLVYSDVDRTEGVLDCPMFAIERRIQA